MKISSVIGSSQLALLFLLSSAVQAQNSAELPDGPAKALVLNACSSCHSPNYVFRAAGLQFGR